MNSCEYVVVHHSVIQNPVQFDIINESHRRRGFPKSSLGFYVGYHYVDGVGGHLRVARAEWEIGAHCNAKSMNYKAIGIVVCGDFRDGRTPDREQIKTLALLLKDIKARHQIPDSKILRHSEVKPTACPGEWDFRAAVAEYWRNVTQEDENARRLQDRFEQTEAEYQQAITIPERNRLRRILDRLKRIAVMVR